MKIFKTVRKRLPVILLILLFAGSITILPGQSTDRLPRSLPETEGVSSSGIIDFINAVDTGRQEIHSFMYLRHGKVIAEGWWDPFGPDYRHIMYSASKTFTATAVGLAVSEGKLRISDKVISFFPYSLPDSIGPFMKELTVRDLLTMSVGQDPEPRAMGAGGDWVSMFIQSEPVLKPGTVFKYNNMATFMLSAIVQQVTGQTVFDYLKPKIFHPLGIRGIDWDLNPQGINLGMIGLRLHTEDMAKFGQLLLQGGTWNKKQLIPKEWVTEATSFKIGNSDPNNKLPDDKNDWAQGYCYQMWRGRFNSVRLDGMAGQFVILFPDKDAVVILTANARNTQDELNLVYNYLLPAIRSDKAIPANPAANSELQRKTETLSLKTPSSKVTNSELEKKISGKEFILDNNANGIQSVYFAFSNEGCTFAIKRENKISSIKAGSGMWKISNSPVSALINPVRGPSSKSIDSNFSVPATSVKVGTAYTWRDSNSLEISARFVEESLGAETVVCRFTEGSDGIRVAIGTGTASPQAAAGRPGGPQPSGQLRGVMVDIK
jgi:CubicO group peptidase (beta-lactamase class C family)